MTVPGNLSSPLLATAAAAAAGGGITKSVRFNSDDSAYLDKNFSSASNRRTWTWAGWHKRAVDSATNFLFVAGSADTHGIYLNNFAGSATLVVSRYVGSFQVYLETTQVFRDPSAWYHIVVAYDSTQSTASDRIKVYVNGVQVTSFSTATYPSPSVEHEINNNVSHRIGRYMDGYLADVYFIDGQQLSPTSFGAFDDNGVWQAAAYSGGSFGTNGFHLLDFANEATVGHDSSGNDNDFTVNNISQASLTTWSNGWSNNLLAGFPATNSFNGTGTGLTIGGSNVKSTWTAPSSIPFTTLSIRGTHDSANIKVNGTDVTSQFTSGLTVVTITGVSSPLTSVDLDNTNGQGNARISAIRIDGELLADATPYPGAGNDVLFDVPVNGDASDDTGAGGELSSNYCVLNPLDQNTATLTNGNLDAQVDSDGARFVRGTIAVSSGKHYWEFTTLSSNNMALGVVETTGTGNLSDSGSYYYYANGGALYGNSSGKASSWGGSTLAVGDVLGVALDMDNGTLQYYKNGSLIGTAWTGLTGKTLAPAIGTGGGSSNKTACNFGQRAFAYGNAGTNRPAATFKALCTSNLPTPTIADGSAHFESKLYTGNSSTNALTMSNSSMSPDWVWIHSRSTGGDHEMFDVVRGANQVLESNGTNQSNSVSNTLTSFDSNGFTLGSSSLVNDNNVTYVAWCWDGGSSDATNTSGSVNSTVRANIAAGFSIVKWSGGSGGTVGHGLGAKPHFIISHKINGSGQWPTYNSEIGATKYMYLNSTIEARSYAHFWNNTEPTSSVFSVGSDSDVSGGTHIAYCFAPVKNYQDIGKYVGTGTSDGAFVHTGFRSALVMIKRITTGESWVFYDTSRDTHNPTVTRAWADLNLGDSANTGHFIDILSNGFKVRSGGGLLGASNNEYFYWAVAENPFQANGGLAR